MKKKISILILAFISCTMLMGASSYVNLGLRKMMDVFGRFKEIHWSNGQITRYEDIGSGGTWGSISGTVSDQTDLQSELDAKLSSAGGTVTGNLAVSGTSTTSGDRVYGSDTVTVIHGGHTYYFPASGMAIVTNADIAALEGLGAEGNILTLLNDPVLGKIDSKNGSATDLVVTRLTVLGIFTIPGNGLSWDVGSSTIKSYGTMTVGTTQGSNANVMLAPDGTGTVLVGSTIGTITPVFCVSKTLGTQTLTGTTTETIYWSKVIPANTLGTDGILELHIVGSATVGNDSTRIIRLYYGGGLVWRTSVGQANTTFRYVCGILANGSTTSQKGLVPQYIEGTGEQAQPNFVISVDSTQDQTLYFTWDPVVATETVILDTNCFKY